MVRIRMSRMGRTHRPFYRINAVEKRTQRNGKVLENLGWYDPMAAEDKQIMLKEDRIKHWLGAGAQPSDTCGDLFARHGVIDAESWQAARLRKVEKKRKKIMDEKVAADAAAKAEAEAAAKAAEEEAKAKAAEEAAAAADAESGGSSDDAPSEETAQ